MFKGLPGSGKSFEAAVRKDYRASQMLSPQLGQVVQPLIQIVNKDTIRRELESKGWQWSHENEKDVVQIRDTRIRQSLLSGYDVISDDTNFGKHEARLRELAKECNADFAVDDSFCKVPIETCIERDSRRAGKAKVGEDVIRKMAKQNGIAQVNPRNYIADESCMKALICDLDGTLCLHNGRSPYDTAKCSEDLVNWPVLGTIRALHNTYQWQVIYLSGRDEEFYDITKRWLTAHACPPGPLHMRLRGDKREDSIVKSELFDAFVRDKYDVQFVLDDRDRVVKMWRSMGLIVFQVAEGAF